ncbi:MAG TPA: serine/threonine protein kinase, partial [Nannocystis exedens]|nr:serine/threonine protein kinase [Nannocystis exedens]
GPKGQHYAGKLLHNSQSQDASAVARFLQEAALLRSLNHVNIVRVIETATVSGQPMLVMERVDGPTLAQLIARDAPLPERLLLAIGRGIAEGLAYAHAHGVIHRDLKPGNVLLQANEPAPIAKIGDFGMARASSLAGVDHRAMTVVGTPDYMAPESVDPLAVDLRSDLYALGCILYEMACGRPPFDAATPLGLLHQHRTAPIPALPDPISPDLRRLIERLLAKSPGERPQAAEAVIQRLDQILRGDRPQALATTPTTVDETGPRCSACGEPLLPELKLCLACGQTIAALDRGNHRIIIIGPGSVGDKFDTQLRDRLVAWIASNPGLHLDTGRIAKKIPRLPFTLCTGVDRIGSESVVKSLEAIGIQALTHDKHALRLPQMRGKWKALTLRTTAIVAASGVYWMKTIWLLPFVLLAVVGISAFTTSRSTTKALPRDTKTTPKAIRNALNKVEAVLPALRARRHRMALRAVVHRSLALSQARHDAADADELGQAIEAATVAAGRLDALDRELERLDIRSATDQVRSSLHERDVWSARLLELTASLDAIQARAAAALHQREAGSADIRLGELSARIEALEEIAALENE